MLLMLGRGFLTLGVSILLCAGCHRSPTSNSPITSAPNDHETYAWAPCVVVQSPGGPPFNIQMQAVQKLQRAGKMTWIRLNAHLDGRGLEYYLEARRLGLNIFAIIHMSDLESAGWETAFDRLHAIYPDDIWAIAGKASNPHQHVKSRHCQPDYYWANVQQ